MRDLIKDGWILTQRWLRARHCRVVIEGIGSCIPPATQFQDLLESLVAGDLTLFAEISADITEVPPTIRLGDLFISCAPHVNWYEVLDLPREDLTFVRLFSLGFKQGDYDYVSRDRFAARVTRRLFQRAQANGFRSLRRLS